MRFIRLNSDQLRQECGAILLCFVVAVVSLFAVGGLAIDSGNLYTARLAAQSAADAAAVSAAAVLARNLGQAAAEDTALEIAQVNLLEKGIDPSSIALPIVDARAASVTVTTQINQRLFLLGGTEGIGGGRRVVRAQAISSILPAVVSLILDTSDSMACPADPADPSDPCACHPNCDVTAGNSKIEFLQKALLGTSPANPGFLSFFTEGRDSINLLAVGHGAELLVPVINGRYSRTDMEAAINGLIAAGTTNTCDAIYRSYQDLEAKGLEGNAAYVYWGDGAPSAGRWVFANPTNNARRYSYNNVLGKPWSGYDYVDWGIADNITNRQGNLELRRYPNQLYLTPRASARIKKLREFTQVDPPAADLTLAFPTYADINRPYRAFYQMATNMEVYLPDGTRHKLGLPGRYRNNGRYRWTNWRKDEHMMLYADCALAAAEATKEAGGVWYAIGYGGGAARGFADPLRLPYQNPDNSLARKDFFNTRIANSPCGIVERHPPFPGIRDLPEVAQSGTKMGVYFATDDPESLQDLFEQMAVKIKIRLIG